MGTARAPRYRGVSDPGIWCAFESVEVGCRGGYKVDERWNKEAAHRTTVDHLRRSSMDDEGWMYGWMKAGEDGHAAGANGADVWGPATESPAHLSHPAVGKV